MSKLPSVFLDIYSSPYQRHYARHDLFKSTKDSLDFVQRLTLIKKLPVHGGCVNTITWNDTGEYILSGSDDQHLCITSGTTYKLLTSLRTRHPANIFSAKFLPNTADKKIISCSGDGMILYTNLDRTEDSFKHCFNCHVGTVYKIMTVPNDSNTFLSCGEDGTVRWFDLRIKMQCTLEECKEDILINCRRPVTALAVNPMLPYQLAIGCYDSSVRIYDRRMLGTQATGNFTGQSYQGLMTKFTVPEFRGKSHRITSLVYSSDSSEVLVSYSTEYLYLFRIKGEEEKPCSLFSTVPGEHAHKKGGSSTPPMKRLRLRGDWSDTGPNARPERELRGESQQRSSHANLMQHVSDVLTRMLNDSARRNRTNLSHSRSRIRASPGREDALEFSNSIDNSDIHPTQQLPPDSHLSATPIEHLPNEENHNATTSRRMNSNYSTSKQSYVTQAMPCTSKSYVDDKDLENAEQSSTASSQAIKGHLGAVVNFPCTSKCSDGGPEMSDDHATLPNNIDKAENVDTCTVDGTGSHQNSNDHSSHELIVEDQKNTTSDLQAAYSTDKYLPALKSNEDEQNIGSLERKNEGIEASKELELSELEPGSANCSSSVNSSSVIHGANVSEMDISQRSGNHVERISVTRTHPHRVKGNRQSIGIVSDSEDNMDEGNDDSDVSSDVDLSNQTGLESDHLEQSRSSSPFDILRCMNKAFKKQKEECDKEDRFVQHLPQPILLQKFTGHRNARTMIKEANFWGDEYVMSGSDCGHVFIWNRHTTELVMIMEADQHVVNCLQPHPYDPVLATSGIDYDIKLWAPQNEEPHFDRNLAAEIMCRNEVMLEETRDTITVPASFMIRMLASFNHLRQGGILARWRQSARSNNVASDDD